MVQAPLTQACFAGQAFPHPPQCSADVCGLTQRLSQTVVPPGQLEAQLLPTQTFPAAHAVPQSPQCCG
jgi:hypothetical protein